MRPGEVNHRLVANLNGEWLDGRVHGGCGEEYGYPAFWHDPSGPRHPVKANLRQRIGKPARRLASRWSSAS